MTPAAIRTCWDHLNAGRPDAAIALLQRALRLNPRDPQANKLLATIHAAHGRDEQAHAHIQRAAAEAPGDAEALFMLGNVCMLLRKHAEGAKAYRACAALRPREWAPWDGLAKCLLWLGDTPGATAAFDAAIAIDPDDPVPYERMGAALSVMGLIREPIDAARRGLARLPDDAALQELLCYQRNFDPEATPAQMRTEHERLGALTARAHPERPFPARPYDPARPLRVAFLSADFCEHACASFLEGPLTHLDPARIDLRLYATVIKDDAVARRFRALPGWRDVSALDPAALRLHAEADALDAVVDCGGWTQGHRMAALSLRLAPVQFTYLGYPNTTGLPTMDGRLVDAVTDPLGPGPDPDDADANAHCTERLIRLPRPFVCYRPPPDAPDTALSPALLPGGEREPITFGSFNRLSKVGPAVIETWAGVLRAVPHSRLLLKSSIVSPETEASYARRFAALGVDPARVAFSSYLKDARQHLTLYRTVDIALDAFPYNGTTTTCEAALMGVPVVTLEGRGHRARVGASLLRALGVPELIAADAASYVAVSAALAADRDRLRALHATLPARLRASPLCDAPGMARALEDALHAACSRPRRD